MEENLAGINNRALIYGAGNNCIYSINELSSYYDIVGICDGDVSKQGSVLFGYTVENIADVSPEDYDVLVLTPSYTESIERDLFEAGVSEDKVVRLEEALCIEKNKSGLSIAVIIYGGLGDFIIAKNWLYHLEEYVGFDNANIETYFNKNMMEAAHSVFDDSSMVDNIQCIDTTRPQLVDEKKYDLILSFSIFPMVRYMDGFTLNSQNPKLYMYAAELRKFGEMHYNKVFFASPDFYRTVSNLFELFPRKKYHEMYDVLNSMSDTASYHCTYSISIDEDQYLDMLGIEKECFITVNTGVNEEYSRKPSTRTWPYKNWIELLTLLRKNIFPGIKIVRMGLAVSGEDSTSQDIDLCGKTSLEQAKVLLKNSLIHIDYEGGLVHLRHVLCGKTSVVLHGPTSTERYGYPENIAIRSDACPKACEWSSRDWLTVCHNDNEKFACMSSVTPEYILRIVMDVLKREDENE